MEHFPDLHYSIKTSIIRTYTVYDFITDDGYFFCNGAVMVTLMTTLNRNILDQGMKIMLKADAIAWIRETYPDYQHDSIPSTIE